MTVKNISQYHDYTTEQLQELSTRHLKEILGSARGRIICDCGKGHHCGDDVLQEDEKNFNEKKEVLVDKLKSIMKTRDNLVSTKQVKKKEKKVLAY